MLGYTFNYAFNRDIYYIINISCRARDAKIQGRVFCEAARKVVLALEALGSIFERIVGLLVGIERRERDHDRGSRGESSGGVQEPLWLIAREWRRQIASLFDPTQPSLKITASVSLVMVTASTPIVRARSQPLFGYRDLTSEDKIQRIQIVLS